jgi:NitT/TauT family transport system substrate-binding protein
MNKMKKLAVTSILIWCITLILGASSCGNGYTGKTETISIGEISDVVMVPIDIADTQGFFAKNGLTASIVTMDSGTTISDALLKGEIDFAAMTEYAIVGSALNQEPVQIIASVNKFESVYIMARKDRGIETIHDLNGKKIAVTRKAIPEFYLGRLLDLNGLSIEEVTLVDVRPPQAGDALANGEVDAAVIREPFASEFKAQLGGKIVTWPAQSKQFAYIVIACRSDWLKEHREIVQRFLTAVDQADEYIINHPDEAKATLRNRLNIDPAYMEETWSENQFSLSLDLSLIVAMNDESRWMIANGLTDEMQAPDLYNYVYVEGLKAVKPEAVNINR